MCKFAIEKTQNSSYEYRLANLYAQKKDIQKYVHQLLKLC